MKSPTFTPSNFICWRHHHQKNPQHSPVSTRSGFSSAVSFGQDGWRRNPSRHCKRNGMQERCPARHEWNPFIFFWGGIYLVDLFPNPVAVTSHHQDYYMFGKESYWAPGGGGRSPLTIKVDTLPLELEQQARLFAGRHIVPWQRWNLRGASLPKGCQRCQRWWVEKTSE